MKNNVYQIDKNKKVIVYFLTYDNREFKGVAKCSPEDVFDEEKGKKIAQLRALINVRETFINETKNIIASIEFSSPYDGDLFNVTPTIKTYMRYRSKCLDLCRKELNTHKEYLRKYKKQLKELI